MKVRVRARVNIGVTVRLMFRLEVRAIGLRSIGLGLG